MSNRAGKPIGETVSPAVLTIGTAVKVLRPKSSNKYLALVNYIEDSFFATSVPTENGKILLPVKGERLYFEFIGNDVLYVFESTFLKSNGASYLHSKPKDIVRVQNREFVRAHTFIHAAVNRDCKGSILNISSGGALLNTETYFPIGEEIHLEFELLNVSLFVRARVVRHPAKNRYGVKFTSLTRKAQDLIMRYVLMKAVRGRKRSSPVVI